MGRLALALLAASASISAGCAPKLGNLELEKGGVGVTVEKVSGDEQSTSTNDLFPVALTVRVYDPITGNPVESAPIEFVQTTPTDAEILIPSVNSSAAGYASTQVKSGSIYDQNITIEARITGTTSDPAVFTLHTIETGLGTQYMVETTNGNIETAGVPFGFTVFVQDDLGNLVTAFNKTRTLIWAWEKNESWTGAVPDVPEGSVSCTFTGGVCTLPTVSILTDTRYETKVWMGDGPTGLNDVFAKPITVLPGAATRVTIANRRGGPFGQDGTDQGGIDNTPTSGDDATALATDVVVSADTPVQSYFAASTDPAGNYVADVSGATWATSNEAALIVDASNDPDLIIDDYLSTNSGLTTDFTPTEAGSGDLTVDAGGLSPTTRTITVNPGVAHHLEVKTFNNNDESPGIPFTLFYEAHDVDHNRLVQHADGTSAFSGDFNTTITINNATSGVPVSAGCPQIFSLADPSLNCITKTYTQAWFSGFAWSGSQKVYLTDATSVTPTITVQTGALGPFPALSGTSPVINLPIGPVARVMPHATLGDNGDPICVINPTNPTLAACHQVMAGDPPETWYAAQEDAGGNFIANVAADWTASLAWSGEWAPTTASVSSTFTPQTAGQGVISVSDGSVGTGIGGSTQVAPLDHFVISVSDGLSPTNVIDATRTYALTIVMYDNSDNVVLTNGNEALTIAYSGQTSSPIGTAPIIATTGTYSFTGGVASIPNLRLPDAYDTVTIDVSQGAIVSNTLSPTLSPGPLDSLQIRTAPNGAGTDVTGSNFTISTIDNPIYYLNTYDSELNFKNSSSSGIWTGTITSVAAVSTPGTFTTVSPTLIGNGILTVDFGGFSVSTGTITVDPGPLDHLRVETENAGTEVAGQPFQVSVFLEDAENNVLTNYSSTGTNTFTIVVIGTSSTIYGYTHTAPSTGVYDIVNGELSPAHTFTLFNSTDTPTLQYSVNIGGGPKFGTVPVTVSNDALDHLRLDRTAASVLAGATHTYNISARDLWGNNTTSGPGATQAVRVEFDGGFPILGGSDITATTLTAASGVAGGSDLFVTGGLSSGAATFTVTATEAGTLHATGDTDPAPGGFPQIAPNVFQTVTVNPDPNVDDVRFKAAFAPPAVYTASPTAPMSTFIVELVDLYGNVITTNSTNEIDLTLTSGSGSLLGTLTRTVSSGAATFSDIRYPRAEAITLRATDDAGVPPWGSGLFVEQGISVVVGPGNQSIAILPSQTYTAGVSSLGAAVTGTPFGTGQITAGSAFNVEFRAVDTGFNTVSTYSSIVRPVSNDPNFTPPSFENFVNGIKSFSVTLTTADQSRTVTANTGLGTDNGSTAFQIVEAAPSQVVLTLPGQTLNEGALSFAAALAGAPTNRTVGSAFALGAYTTDAYFNVVDDDSTQLSIGLSDPDGTQDGPKIVANGQTSFNVTYITANNGGTAQITSSSDQPGTYTTARSSSQFTVNNLAASQTIAILPGQTYDPGELTQGAAVSGTPTDRTAGVPFSVEVRAVDTYFNTDPGLNTSGSAVALSTSDPNDTAPTNQDFILGVATFSATNITAGSAQTVLPVSTLSDLASDPYDVDPNTGTQTIIVLPGQTFSPGKFTLGTAVTGAPTAQAAAVAFNAVVYAVDDWFNVVADSLSSVSITTDDPNDVDPGAQTLSSGTQTYSATNITAGSRSMVAVSPYATENASSTYTVNAGAAVRAIVILPGQTYTPGVTPGVSGTPSAQSTTSTFNAELRAVDANYNTNASHSGAAAVDTSDPTDTEPGTPLNFGAGVATFTISPVTATVTPAGAGPGATVTPSGTGLVEVASSAYDVNPGPNTRTIVILPGETFNAGQQSIGAAITGSATDQVAASGFTANVKATDAEFNLVDIDGTGISVSTSDANDTDPSAGTFTDGVVAFTVTNATASGTNTITPTGTGPTASNNYRVRHGSPTQSIVVLPGQTHEPGKATLGTAVTGAPTTQTAAIAFNATVLAVDSRFNAADGANGATAHNGTVSVASSDANDTDPVTPTNFASGQATFSFTNVTAGAGQTITPATTLGADNASSAYTVSAAGAIRTIVVLPGQTYTPGVAPGLSGSPSAQSADSDFTAVVRAVDANYNTDAAHGGAVAVDTSDPTDTEPGTPVTFSSGVANFTISPVTATVTPAGPGPGATVTPTGTGLTEAASGTYDVNPGAYAATIVVLPGQTYNPGQQSLGAAITGSPTIQTAGGAFSAVVRATDAEFNLRNDDTTSISLATSDANDVNPGSQTLTDGSATYSVTNFTAGSSHSITPSGVGPTASSTYAVRHAGAAKSIVVLPGQTHVPGTSSLGAAVTGTPTPQKANSAFTAAVKAVDTWFNTADGADGATAHNGTVSVVTSDPNDTDPVTPTNFTSGQAAFSVTNVTVGLGRTITPTTTLGADNASSGYDVTADRLVFTIDPVNTKVGTTLANVRVEARDGLGNTDTTFGGSVSLAIGVNPNSATLGGTTSVSAVSGVADFGTLTVSRVGENMTLVASATGLTGATSAAFDSTADRLVFTVHPSNTKVGTAISSVTVAAQDGFSNTDPTFAGSVTIGLGTNPNSASVSGTNPQSATSGTVSFADLSVNKVGASMTLTAASAGLLTGTSNAFDSTADRLAFTTQPADTRANTDQTVVVSAQDSFGNTDTTYGGSVTLALGNDPTGGSSGFTVTSPRTASSGQATFNDLRFTKIALAYDVSASAAGLTGATSGAFNITADRLVFSVQPATTKVGTTFASFTARGEDGFGTLDTTFAGSVTIGFGNNPNGAAVSGTNPKSAVGGSVSFTDISINKVGPAMTFTAASAGLTGATSSAFDSTADRLAFTTGPAHTKANASQSVVVSAQDGFGNTDTTYGGSVTLALGTDPTGGSSGFSVTSPRTASTGAATFNDLLFTKIAQGYTVTAAAAGLSGATSGTFNVTADRLAFSVHPASTQVGTAFASFTVLALDGFGITDTTFTGSVTIGFGNNPNGAAVSGTNPGSAAAGSVSFTDISINKVGAAMTFTASSAGLTGATSNAFDSTADRLVFTSQPANTQANANQSVAVSARDGFGNTDITYGGSVSLALGTDPTSGSSGFTVTSPATAVSGVATFSDVRFTKVAQGYDLTASAAGLSGATSSSFNITADRLVFTTQPANAKANATQTVVVSARDGLGTTDTTFGGNVTLSLGNDPTGGSSGFAVTSPRTAVSGQATFNDLIFSKIAQGYTVSTASAGLTGATSSAFDITADRLAFSVQPASTKVGTAFASFTVRGEDAFGIVDPNFSGSVTIGFGNNPNGALLSGTNPKSAVAGSVSFTDLTVDEVGASVTFTASSAGLTGATSSSFHVTADRLRVSTQPVDTQANSNQTVVIAAGDSTGNTDTTFGGSVSLALGTDPTVGSSGFTVTSPATAVSGVATFSDVRFTKIAQGYDLSATSTGLIGITTSAFDITADRLAFSVQPGNTKVGTAFASFTVRGVDGLGTLDPGFTGSVTIGIGNNPNSASLSGTNPQSATAGSVSFTDLSLNKVGAAMTFTASSAGLTGATSSAFDSTADRLIFTTQPANTQANANQTVAVSARDGFGNTDTTYGGSVSLALGTDPTGGSSGFTVTSPQTASSGVAIFSDVRFTKVAQGYDLTASAAGLSGATSGSFNITADRLIVTTQPVDTKANANQTVVITARDGLGTTDTTFGGSVALALNTDPTGGSSGFTVTSPQTASSGVATFNDVRFAKVAQNYDLAATSSGLTSAVTAAFDITADRLAFSVHPANTKVGTTLATVTVQARDGLGTVDTTFSGTIDVAIGTNPNSATLSGTTSVGATTGASDFADLSLNKVGAAMTLTAASAGLTGATSNAFNSTADRLVFTDQPDSTAADQNIATVKVSAQDGFSNTDTTFGASVSILIDTDPSSGTATLGGTTSASAASGVANFDGLLNIDKAFNGYTLRATSTGLTNGVSSSFNIIPGVPATVAFQTQPAANQTAGNVFGTQPVVLVQDSEGNTVGNGTNVTLTAFTDGGCSSGAGGSLSGASVTTTSGLATFTTLSYSAAQNPLHLKATAGSATGCSNATQVFPTLAFVVTPVGPVSTSGSFTFEFSGGVPAVGRSISPNNSGASPGAIDAGCTATTGDHCFIYTAGVTGGTLDTVRVTDSASGSPNGASFVVTVDGPNLQHTGGSLSISTSIDDSFAFTFTNNGTGGDPQGQTGALTTQFTGDAGGRWTMGVDGCTAANLSVTQQCTVTLNFNAATVAGTATGVSPVQFTVIGSSSGNVDLGALVGDDNAP